MVLIGAVVWGHGRMSEGPTSALRQAWLNAEASGRYDFQTRLTTTTLPSPKLTSAGTSAKVSTIVLRGTADRAAGRVALTLWNQPAAGLDPAQGMAIEIDGHGARARLGDGAWQEMDGFDASFAPAGDAAAFLVAARNLRPLGSQTRSVPSAAGATRDISFQRYAFTLDGQAYADYLRDLVTEQLRAAGELPEGGRLGVNVGAGVLSAASEGEAWVDLAGRPLRLALTMEQPQAGDGTRTKVEIQTDFSGYAEVATGIGAILRTPGAWLAARIAGADPARLAADSGLLALFMAATVLCLGLWRRRPRLAYQLFAGFMVVQLITAPLCSTLLRTGQIERLLGRFPQARTAWAAEGEAPKTAIELAPSPAVAPSGLASAALLPQFAVAPSNPATAWPQASRLDGLPAVVPAQSPMGVDSDGDGLTDDLEILWGTRRDNPDTDLDNVSDFDETALCLEPEPRTADQKEANRTDAGCPNPLKGDTDGDRLLDDEEVLHIGTSVNAVDSDGDAISDYAEVKGYLFGAERRYTNVLALDSDKDDLPDGIECPSLRDVIDPAAPFTPTWTPNIACVDSGKPDAPDVDNIDNDGDGVPNRSDLSPFVGVEPVFDDANPFQLVLRQLELDRPVVVDLQLRPTNPRHLTFAQNVLDWPTGDAQGQVQRLQPSTFGDLRQPGTGLPLFSDPADSANNGDLRLVPMLEVTMPQDTRDLPRTTARATVALDNAGELVGRVKLVNKLASDPAEGVLHVQAIPELLAAAPAGFKLVKAACGTSATPLFDGSLDSAGNQPVDLKSVANLGVVANGQYSARLLVAGIEYCTPVASLVEGMSAVALVFQRSEPDEIERLGSLAIEQDGAGEAAVDFQFTNPSASYNVRIHAGSCTELGAEMIAFEGLQGNVQRSIPGKNATDLADGAHVVVLGRTGQTDVELCRPLGNIVSGFSGTANQVEMIDQTLLDSYQITVAETQTGELAALLPLTMSTDFDTGGPVAFNGAMFYRRSLDVPQVHRVRLRWFVWQLNDGGQLQLIHQYVNEGWRLTGLNVREERSIDAAVVWEDPATDERQQQDGNRDTTGHLEVDDDLWRLATNLEDSFVAARTGASGQRDMTVAEIGRRWGSQAAITSDTARWGIAPDALQVRTVHYAGIGELGAVGSELIPGILTEQFGTGIRDVTDLAGNPRTVLVPTLLVAMETRGRSLNLDGAVPDGTAPPQVSLVGGSAALDLDPARVPEVTAASMSWKPYRTRPGCTLGSCWESFPLDEYWLGQEKKLRVLAPFKADAARGEAGRFAAAADLAVAQVVYARLYAGIGGAVQVGTTALKPFGSAASDEELVRHGEISTLAQKEVGSRIYPVIGGFFKHYVYKPIKQKYNNGRVTNVIELKEFVGRQFVEKPPAGETAWGNFKAKGGLDGHASGAGVMRGIAIVAGIGNMYCKAEVDPAQGVSGNNVCGSLLKAVTLADNVTDFYRNHQAYKEFLADAANQGKGFRDFLKDVDTKAATWVTGAVTVVVGGAVAFGFFFWQVGQSKGAIEVGGQAYNEAIASIVAGMVLDAALMALSTVGVGQFIVAILSLFDTVVSMFCAWFKPADDNVVAGEFCKGIQGMLKDLIAYLLYDETDVVDIRNPERLTVSRFAPALKDPPKGFVPSAGLALDLTVHNRVTRQWPDSFGAAWPWHFYEEQARKSSFAYAITTDPAIGAPKAVLGGTTDWSIVGNELSMQREVAGDLTLPRAAGINQPLPAWLAESAAYLTQQCGGFGLTICALKERSRENAIELGLSFDVFPPTLDEFYALTPTDSEGGRALAWGHSASWQFPTLVDADGDGLKGRDDPDDGNADRDGDGILDPAEKLRGSDPLLVDSDQDQLDDAAEAHFGSDPTLADEDGDGLTDAEEKRGWAILYNAKGDRTWVYPDPRLRDGDGDEFADKQELVLGLSPWAANDSTALDYTTALVEPNAPILLLRLDEPGGATSVADSARPKSPFIGGCASPACPVTGHSAPIGNSVRFDGQDDYFALGAVPPVSALTSDFVVSAWIRPDRVAGRQRIVGLSTEFGNDGFGFGLAGDGLYLTFPGVADFVATEAKIPVAEWTWVSAMARRVTHPTTGAVSTAVELWAVRLGDLGGSGGDSWFHTTLISPTAGATADRNEPLAVGAALVANPAPGATRPLVTEPFGGRIDEVVIANGVLNTEDAFKQRMLGIHNLNDGVVAPGQDLVHETAVANRLLSRSLSGILKLELPKVLTSPAPVYEKFSLGPAVLGAPAAARQTIRHPLAVGRSAASGRYTVGQDMAATIDRRSVPLGNLQDQSYLADLVYDLDRAVLVLDNPEKMALPPRKVEPTGPWGERVRYRGGDITIAAWLEWRDSIGAIPGFRYGVMGADAGRDQAPIGGFSQYAPRSTADMSKQAYPSLIVERGHVVFGFGCDDGDNGWCEVTSAQPYVTRGQRVHVAVSYNKASQKATLYINQEPREDLALTGMLPRPADSFVIGSANEFSYALRPVANNRCPSVSSYETVNNEDGSPNWFRDNFQNAPYRGTIELVPISFRSNFRLEYVPGKATAELHYLQIDEPFKDLKGKDVDPTVTESADGCATTRLARHTAMPFSGTIADLEVYNRALTRNQINDLVSSNSTIARYKLDEVPGEQEFEDYVGGTQPFCQAGSGYCPVTGARGRENLAAVFDGVDDRIEDNTVGLLLAAYLQTAVDTGYSLGAWVRPGSAQQAGAFLALGTLSAVPAELRVVPVAGKPDKLRFWFGQGDDKVWSFPTNEYVRDAWHHVIVAVDTRQPTSSGQLYVDGVAVGSPFTGSQPGLNLTIGSGPDGARPYQGLIDDVFIGKGFLDAAGVRALVDSVPARVETMDDPPGAPPASGRIQGQINEARVFDKPADALALGSADALNLLRGDFTLSAWVMGDALGGKIDDIVYRPIVVGADGTRKIFLGLFNGRPYAYLEAADTRSNTVVAATALPPNVWTHVVFRRKSDPSRTDNEALEIFVQGSSVQRAISQPKLTADPGKTVQIGGNAAFTFKGRLDELMFYRVALNDEDIARLFNFQNTWIDETSTQRLTVDAEPPTASFAGSGRYLPRKPTALEVTAKDRTSSAALAVLEFNSAVQGKRYVWGFPCRDAVGGSVMCLVFDPPGEGRYDVVLFPVDAVGNVAEYKEAAPGRKFFVLVDGTAPVLTVQALPTGAFRPRVDAKDASRWYLDLAGTVSDPALATDPGSGVQQVTVEIHNENGVALGDPALQPATLSGASWSRAYTLRADRPTGTFSGVVKATDKVGNVQISPIPPFHLDGSDPTTTMTGVTGAPGGGTRPLAGTAQDSPTYLGASAVLQGTVDEQPDTDAAQDAVAGVGGVQVMAEPLFTHGSALLNRPLPANVVLHLPFDKSGQAATPDISFGDLAQGLTATCAGAQCPSSGAASRNGQALRFDGMDDGLSVPHFAELGELANDFTVAAWIKPDGTNGKGRIVSSPRTDNSDGFSFSQNGTGLQLTSWNVRDYDTADGLLTPGVWQHVAVHVTADNDAEFFVNGRLVETVPGEAPFRPDSDSPLLIGTASLTDAPLGEPFHGAIDEVVVARSDLTAADWEMFLGLGPSLHLAFDERSLVAGTRLADQGGMGALAEYKVFEPSDASNHAQLGTVGSGALNLTPASDGFVVSAPKGVLPRAGHSFSLAVWVQDMNLGTLAYGPNAIELGQVLSASFHGLGYPVAVGDPRGWHHVVLVWDETAGELALFWDGSAARRDVVADGSGLTEDLTELRFTHKSASERYALDDLRAYPRALAPLEVAALASAHWVDATVTGIGAAPVSRASWTAGLPAGLEAYYDLKVRGADRQANVDLEPPAQWTGLVDTLEPRLMSGTYQPSASSVAFSLAYEDFNLDLSSLDLPGNCSQAVNITPVGYRSPWHLALADQLTGAAAERVRNWTSGVTIECTATQIVTDEVFGACDLAGNCLRLRYPGPSIGAPPVTPSPGASPTPTRSTPGTPPPTVGIATATRTAAPPTVAVPTATVGPVKGGGTVFLPVLVVGAGWVVR
jgi:hypothetical protein